MDHVVLIRSGLVRAILDGRKRAEARLSRNRIAPFARVAPGDTLWFRRVGGGYVATARVHGVVSAESLSQRELRELHRQHAAAVAAPPAFWHARSLARYATIVHFEHVEPVSTGPNLERKPGDRHAWFVLAPTLARAA